jgi:hypothetical protein
MKISAPKAWPIAIAMLAPTLFAFVCVAGELPDRSLTPGDVFENVTLADLRVRGYSKKVRRVSEAERRAIFVAYGIRWGARYDYELDHLCPLCIGGSNSEKNLWPEPRFGTWNAAKKDVLEDRARELIISGRVDLKTIQREIETNWIYAYKKYVGDQ